MPVCGSISSETFVSVYPVCVCIPVYASGVSLCTCVFLVQWLLYVYSCAIVHRLFPRIHCVISSLYRSVLFISFVFCIDTPGGLLKPL